MPALVSSNIPLNPFYTLQEATKLLSALPQELADRVILIGGQALLLWGEYYLIDRMTGQQLESLASDDLDFMGRKPEVIDCARVWHGEHKLPHMDDHTPQSGIVLLNNQGVTETVDFLSQVYGVSDKDVYAFSDKMKFGNNLVRVLSPPLCLKSRIENLYGLHYGKEKQERERLRITAAITACYFYLIDICEAQQTPRAIAKAVTYIANHILLSNAAVALSAKFGYNFQEVFPVNKIAAVNSNITEKFLSAKFKEYEEKVCRKKQRPEAT